MCSECNLCTGRKSVKVSSLTWLRVCEWEVRLGQNLTLNPAEHFLTVRWSLRVEAFPFSLGRGGCWVLQFIAEVTQMSLPSSRNWPIPGVLSQQKSLECGTFCKQLSFCSVGSRLLIWADSFLRLLYRLCSAALCLQVPEHLGSESVRWLTDTRWRSKKMVKPNRIFVLFRQENLKMWDEYI